MTIIDALRSPKIFRPLFRDLESWRAWEVYLRALFGLGITDPADLEIFKRSTGLDHPPAGPAREAYAICGRRSGKSFVTAIIAVYLACFKDWRTYLSPGERGWIFIVAVDKNQASIIKKYISGIFEKVKHLGPQVQKETAESIELRNGISIGVRASSYRSLRGYTVLCAVLEELAFYRSEEAANPDKEILAALRPALATIPESLLLGISTPYSRSGVLFDMFKNYYGKTGGPLIWKAPTTIMNPTVDVGLIARALQEDPQAARAEWNAEWRDDIEAFISVEVVESAVVPGRQDLPYVWAGPRPDYVAFIDPSGGRQDSFTLAIAHQNETGRIILDVLRERRPPFQPKEVVKEFSEALHAFHVESVTSDRYAGEWVPEAFREHGVFVNPSGLTCSENYQNFLPLLMNGRVELPDMKRLISQLIQLERRARTGGREFIDHPPGGHDDLAAAAAGAAVLAAKDSGGIYFVQSKHDVYGDEAGVYHGPEPDLGPPAWAPDPPAKKNIVLTTNSIQPRR